MQPESVAGDAASSCPATATEVAIAAAPSRPTAGRRRPIRHLRWWIIGLVTLGTVLNYLARSTLSVAAPTLRAELHMSTAQYSYVVMVFQLAYTVMQTVAGSVLDLLGRGWGSSCSRSAGRWPTWAMAWP